MNWFLKLKHWQFFLMLFGIPLVLTFLFVGRFVAVTIENQQPDFAALNSIWWYVILVNLVVVGLQTGWFWSVGVGLQKYLPGELRRKTTLFKISVLVPVVTVIAVTFFIIDVTRDIGLLTNEIYQENPEEFMRGYWRDTVFSVLLILPLGLLSTAAGIYNIYFTGRTLRTVEKRQQLSIEDYIGDCILIWFLVIGIWFVQPRINKIVANGAGSHPADRHVG